MSIVAMTMRRDAVPGRNETRDAVETTWWKFLALLGHTPLILPNHVGQAEDLLRSFSPSAAIMTGGGAAVRGVLAGPRDDVEAAVLAWAITTQSPLIGVCRGMQALALLSGGELTANEPHLQRRGLLRTRFGPHRTICYHEKSLNSIPNDFLPASASDDGVIEAIEHRRLPIFGLMWHPERAPGFDGSDIRLFREVLNA